MIKISMHKVRKVTEQKFEEKKQVSKELTSYELGEKCDDGFICLHFFCFYYSQILLIGFYIVSKCSEVLPNIIS